MFPHTRPKGILYTVKRNTARYSHSTHGSRQCGTHELTRGVSPSQDDDATLYALLALLLDAGAKP